MMSRVFTKRRFSFHEALASLALDGFIVKQKETWRIFGYVLLSRRMDKNMKDLLETVIFIKDNMVTKDELVEVEKRWGDMFGALRKEMQDGFRGVMNRIGGIDNRIDDEMFARKDLENRVRTVLPDLPVASERV